MKKAIIYTRVSTDEQANNGYSLQHQKALLEQYCKVKDIEIAKHYQEDFSAKTFNRPEIKLAFDYCKANKKNIDLFVFTKCDRFSRNQEEALKAIRQLQDLGIEVCCVEQPLDLENPDNKILLSMYLIIPEVENDKNSMRTKDGMRRAMKEGCFMGKAPVGYIHHRDEFNNSTLKINEQIAPLIRNAFEEFSSGLHSANSLRIKYMKDGLKSSKQGFVNMLRNVAYTGKILIPEWKKDNQEIVVGLHPILISEDVFNKVAFVLSGKKKSITVEKPNDEFLPLKQEILCSVCGKKYTGAPSLGNGGLYWYYHCQKRCTGSHRVEIVHSLFLEFLKQYEIKEEILKLYSIILEDKFSENFGKLESKKTSIDNEITMLNEKIIKLENSIGDADISAKRLMEIIKRHECNIEQLKQEKMDIAIVDKEFNLYLKFGISFLNGLSVYFDSSTIKIKKMIISSIFPEKLIFDGKYYRTVKENEFLNLIFNNNKVLGDMKIEKATPKSGLSKNAPSLGLEPRTL